MTLRDIALSAAVVLQADDIEAALSDTENAASDDADVKAMLKCVNLAAAEAASDFPVLKTLETDCDGELIPLSAFDPVPVTVCEVKCDGAIVSFKLDDRGVRVPHKGRYTVVYTAAYEDAQPDDELSVGVGADRETLTYLAARNYCIVTGRTDEASVWDQRYNAETENKRLRRRARLPKRTWLE